MKASLLKFLKKSGKDIGDLAKEGGKTAKKAGEAMMTAAKNPHGTASLAGKGVAKLVEKNPKKSAAIAGAGGAALGMASGKKDDKKKKRPYMKDDE